MRDETSQRKAGTTNSHPAGQMALLMGASISVALLLYTSAKNGPLFLLALASLWLLSPFAYLFVIARSASHWNVATRTILSMATSILALAIVSLYSITYLGPLRPWAFAVSVFLPPLLWTIISVVAIVIFSLPERKVAKGNTP